MMLSFFVQEFEDLSYHPSRMTSFEKLDLESMTDLKHKFFKGVISSLFFGRSAEIYNLIKITSNSEIVKDELLRNDGIEAIVNETEKKIFNKKMKEKLKNK